jgi:hypothetical protein
LIVRPLYLRIPRPDQAFRSFGRLVVLGYVAGQDKRAREAEMRQFRLIVNNASNSYSLFYCGGIDANFHYAEIDYTTT